MDGKHKYDSDLRSQARPRRSIFDFSSVEDLRQTDEDFDPISSDKTRPLIPFQQSYIAHAPSRHLFTLNRRYTYFGGQGASSKDTSGSVEDLTGYITEQKRTVNLSKFSKSSPDLRHASYQTSDGYDVTSKEDLSWRLDKETDMKNEREHGNEASTKRGENSKNDRRICFAEYDPTVRLETKWPTKTEHEARFPKLETTKQETRQANTDESTLKVSDKLNATETTTHGLHPGTNVADVSLATHDVSGAESEYNQSETFDKGWQTILHSGKAQLRKSLESLNSFRQDMNSREIQNVDMFVTEDFDSIALPKNVSEEQVLESKIGVGGKDLEKVIEQDDKMANLNMDALMSDEKLQQVSLESVDQVCSHFDEDRSRILEVNKANQTSVQTCATSNLNANQTTQMLTREKTANGNEEKHAALSMISFENDKEHSSTLHIEAGVVDEQNLCSDMKMFYTSNSAASGPKEAGLEGSSESGTAADSTVLQKEGMIDFSQAISDDRLSSADAIVDGERTSGTSIRPCNVSPISFRVLSASTSCEGGKLRKNTDEYRGETSNATVKVSGIRQSSICVAGEDEKTTYKSVCTKSHEHHNPYGDETLTKDTSLQSIEEEEQSVSFNNESNRLDNIADESVNSTKETTDNSLINNMMGMFCLLGLKDSPDGGFYKSVKQANRSEQDTAKDISNAAQSRADDTINNTSETTLHTPQRNDGKFFDPGNFDDEKLNNIDWEEHNTSYTTALKETNFSEVNTIDDTMIQQITLYENPQKQATVEEYISDVITGNTVVLENNIDKRNFLSKAKADDVLYVSDIEREEQEKAVQYRHTEGNIDESNLLQTGIREESLLQTPETSVENVDDGNETDNYEAREERTVKLPLQENDAIDYNINLDLSKDIADEENMKTTTTSNLHINRNKWSEVFIMTPGRMAESTGSFHVLVLDNELTPTSPQCTSTVITLNLFPPQTKEKYSQKENLEVGQALAQKMNVDEKEFVLKVDDVSAVIQEHKYIDSNCVTKRGTQNNLNDNTLDQHPTEFEVVLEQDNLEYVDPKQSDDEKLTFLHRLKARDFENAETEVDKINEVQQPIEHTHEAEESTTNVENVNENIFSDSAEKHRNECIIDPKHTSGSIQSDFFAEFESGREIRETFHKVDAKERKNERLSECLMCFEMEKLVDEKINKHDKTEQENLLSEIDEAFLVGNVIQETISKGKNREVQYELFSQVDELFTAEEGMEERKGVMKYDEENNNLISSSFREVSSPELTTSTVAEKSEGFKAQYSPRNEVPEVITRTVDDKSLRNLPQLDDVLKSDYVEEIIPNKVEVQRNNEDYHLESDKYFDSITTVQEPEIIHNIQLGQSEQRRVPELLTKNIEEALASNTRLISFQLNKVEITSIESDKNDSGVCGGEDAKNDPWKISFDTQIVVPAEEVEPVTSNDNLDGDNREELILVISNANYRVNSAHLNDDDDDDHDDVCPDDDKDDGVLDDDDDYGSADDVAGNDDDNSRDDDGVIDDDVIDVIDDDVIDVIEDDVIEDDVIEDDVIDDGVIDDSYYWRENDNYDEEDDQSQDDINQYIVSPIPDDLLSVVSNYDASVESPCASLTQDHESEERLLNNNVPWNVTVSYSNPDTMKCEYKILRASYSNIQSDIYHVAEDTADAGITGDAKDIDGETQSEILELGKTSVEEVMSYHTAVLSESKSTVTANDGSDLDEGNHYRTTMGITPRQNQVNTSYMLFQRFGKQESQRTYFELNYDMDEWKVGENVTSSIAENKEKTFVVSYATIERVNHLQLESERYLPAIEERNDEDMCDNQEDQYLGTSHTPPAPLNAPAESPPPIPLTPLSPSLLLPSLSTTTTTRTDAFEVREDGTELYAVPYSLPENLSPENKPDEILKATRVDEFEQEIDYNPPEISAAPERKGPTTFCDVLSQAPQHIEDVQLVEVLNHDLEQEQTPQMLSLNLVNTIPHRASSTMQPNVPPTEDNKVDQHLPAPLEISSEQSSNDHPPVSIIQSQIQPPISRPPVWSFAQSVFHTDGQSKTFFKVIDNRKKSFQSSTFVYRGERVKVSRGVNVYKNHDVNDEYTMDNVDDKDYEGYSEIWNDGNLMTGNVLALFAFLKCNTQRLP